MKDPILAPIFDGPQVLLQSGCLIAGTQALTYALTPSLPAFLRGERLQPWSWGYKNCTLWVVDWIFLRTGIDLGSRWRGLCDSGEEWHKLIKREGGFMPLVGFEMDQHFERTQSPEDGDVGIVSAPLSLRDRFHVVGAIPAIRSSGIWVTRGAHGLHYEDLPTITAWRLPVAPRIGH